MSTSIDFGHSKPQVQFRTVEELGKVEEQGTVARSKSIRQSLRKSLALEDPPERFLWENLRARPRSMSHHLSSVKVPSRRWLKVRAKFWRGLQAFAMHLHDLAPPKAPRPTFMRKIPTDTIPVELYFYCPPEYHMNLQAGHRYPVVVNFHGGGFCLGHATDDRYWARVVLARTKCVFVSVNYRRAPEHPFPTPVDDGVDALLYLAKNADMLGLDTTRTALTGFSAGANLAFSVPMRLKYYTFSKKISPASSTTSLQKTPSSLTPASSPTSPEEGHPSNFLTRTPSTYHRPPFHTLSSTFTPHPTPAKHPSNLRITTIAAFYPLLDWTQSRSAKKRLSINPNATLPKHFTDLFDYSYLPPPDTSGIHCSPYASPGLAPDHFLRASLPDSIQMVLCEWDMLLAEGQKFAHRLDHVGGKRVDWRVVPRVPHGWDKSPSPWRDQKGIDDLYESVADGIGCVFDG